MSIDELTRAKALLSDLYAKVEASPAPKEIHTVYRGVVDTYGKFIDAEEHVRTARALEVIGTYKLRSMDASTLTKAMLWMEMKTKLNLTPRQLEDITIGQVLVDQGDAIGAVGSTLDEVVVSYEGMRDDLVAYEQSLWGRTAKLSEEFTRMRDDLDTMRIAYGLEREKDRSDLSLPEKAQSKHVERTLERDIYRGENTARRMQQDFLQKNKQADAISANIHFMEGYAHLARSMSMIAHNMSEYIMHTAHVIDAGSRMGNLGIRIIGKLNVTAEGLDLLSGSNASRLAILSEGYERFMNGTQYDGFSRTLLAPTNDMRAFSERIEKQLDREIEKLYR